MCLLPGPADSRLKAFSFRGRSSAFGGRRKNGVCLLYHVKANQNFAKNKSKTKKLPLTWYVNCG